MSEEVIPQMGYAIMKRPSKHNGTRFTARVRLKGSTHVSKTFSTKSSSMLLLLLSLTGCAAVIPIAEQVGKEAAVQIVEDTVQAVEKSPSSK